jgi:hypothetical protein
MQVVLVGEQSVEISVVFGLDQGNLHLGGEVGHELVHQQSSLDLVVLERDGYVPQPVQTTRHNHLANLVHLGARYVLPENTVARAREAVDKHVDLHEIATNPIETVLECHVLALQLGGVSLFGLLHRFAVELLIFLHEFGVERCDPVLFIRVVIVVVVGVILATRGFGVGIHVLGRFGVGDTLLNGVAEDVAVVEVPPHRQLRFKFRVQLTVLG